MATAASAQRARRALLGPTVFGIAVIGLRLALVAAGLAAAYLLYGLLAGGLEGFPALPRPERARIFENILLGRSVLNVSVTIAAILAAYVYVSEEVTGYILALIGGALYAGIPYAALLVINEAALPSNPALHQALSAFPHAAWAPLLFGGLLIARDLAGKLLRLVRTRALEREKLTYGGDARPEPRTLPVRLSLLGKCWEGPFCRDFIRPHCPIFQARKACWRVRKGCYCEEEIVNIATQRIMGQQLAMAPDPRYNFVNDPTPGKRGRVELTMAQKRERCRQCVIYNQHQRDKYRLLMPALIGVILIGAALLAPTLREYLHTGLSDLDTLMARLSFGQSTGKPYLQFGNVSPLVEWALVGAITVMVLSKALQTLEWAIFKLKV